MRTYEARYVKRGSWSIICSSGQSHPNHVTPSWYGDSVGHYEGDTLVIDTVGINTDRSFAMVDQFGTPFTEALHVVEHYRLI